MSVSNTVAGGPGPGANSTVPWQVVGSVTANGTLAAIGALNANTSGTANAAVYAMVSNTTNYARIYTNLNAGSPTSVLEFGSTISTAQITSLGATAIQLNPNNATTATFAANGNIGFGTTTPDRTLTVNGASRSTLVALTDAANIATNMVLGNYYTVTLGGNRNLDFPTNVPAGGQSGAFIVRQDATGNRTLTFSAGYKFVGQSAPVLTSAANAVDVLPFLVVNSTFIVISQALDLR